MSCSFENLIPIRRLGNNQLGDEAGKALAEALKINTTLYMLEIRDNNFSDKVKKTISQAVKGRKFALYI
eukprot:m.77834 g.77834  ORF g.77834 m.77834 type:complete len:69 (+) comp14723_c1_seq1:495-701(+)